MLLDGADSELHRNDLRAHPTLIRSAIEELLRYESPVQASSRTVLEDIEIDGTRVRPGESLSLMVGAANRDPRQFEQPDVLDSRRANNAHLSFGAGAHFCIGNTLARLEGQVAHATADRANSGQISTRRDGRVVDGGGLENLIARSSEFAIFRLNSARCAR